MMNLIPNADQTIVGLIPKLRSREISCVELVARCLRAIDQGESQIRAWVLVDRHPALATARARDDELAAGRDRGPLHGIPLGIKDIVDVAGWPTAAGSPQWKDRIADRDAFLVMRLKEAGAVLLGKTVTTPYASFDPPVTRNPWDLSRTPGGSSSGSAAAVAAGMCLGAIGSQTGGSITRPASFCGVAGLKPTYGRVSARGLLPLAPSMDHPGPIARCVDDLAIMYQAIAGYDPEDPYSVDAPTSTVDEMQAALDDSTPPRLGRLAGLFEDLADGEMLRAFSRAMAILPSAGAAVRPVSLPPPFDGVLAAHRLIMAVEAAAIHEQRIREFPAEYGPWITALIHEGLGAGITDYVRARQHQLLIQRAILTTLAGQDALVCPATTGAAPDAATTGNPAFNSPWSYCGLPTISFPIGLSSDGLPLAIQLVGRPLEEAQLFHTARWCERALLNAQP